MKRDESAVAIVGMGQMGGVFARAILGAGHTVAPILRDTPDARARDRALEASLVLVAVGEADLGAALEGLPAEARDRVGLLQNELLPCDWSRRGVVDPTVAVVWFEKKAHKALKPIRSTPVAGPWAAALVSGLGLLEIPAHVIPAAELPAALVLKNLYILASNLGGLATGAATVGELAESHASRLREIAEDILALERARLGEQGELPADDTLFARLLEAFADDPTHGARGRSAPARLGRALERADALHIDAPALRSIDPG
jgi:hypothetical protein